MRGNDNEIAQCTTAKGLIEIASHEAVVQTRYLDSEGYWTIGIGHTAFAGAPDPFQISGELTIDEVMHIFARDIKKFEANVRNAFTVELEPHQFDAAVSFDFNTGAIDRADWVKDFNRGDIEAARKNFMNWRKPASIIERREKERDLFFDGVYSSDGKINIYPADEEGKVQWSEGQRIYFLPSDLTRIMANTSDETPQKLRTLKFGMQGDDVRWMQISLRQSGFFDRETNGQFCLTTETALRYWQGSKGLAADGIFGPLSRAAMGMD